MAVFGLTLILGSCKPEKGVNGDAGGETRMPSECQKLIEEIVTPQIITENAVVFLLLSKLEYDIQPRELQFEIDEVIDDFYAYKDRAINKIKRYGINDVSTISKNLVFRYPDGREEEIYFDTAKGWVALGLFGKGKKPKIVYHAIHEDDIMKAVSEYFEIEIK
jgi:hypothetical protein